MSPHAVAVAHLDLTGHNALDYPSIEPSMPRRAQDESDVSQILFCKLYHLNNYRKDLIKRDASGQNVTTYYADATDEADECLAKIQAIANAGLSMTTFPSLADIQTLTTAMSSMEKALANSAVLATLVSFATTVIQTIPAKNMT
jgi:hypothetical protein